MWRPPHVSWSPARFIVKVTAEDELCRLWVALVLYYAMRSRCATGHSQATHEQEVPREVRNDDEEDDVRPKD